MAATFQNFVQAQYVAASLTDYLTVSASTRIRIDKMTVINQSAGPETITVAIAPGGVTADNKHRIYIAKSIPADGIPVELTSMAGRILEASDVVRAMASTLDTMAIWIDGVLFN